MITHPLNQALLTDLYQLTMAAGYFQKKMTHQSTFELFVRTLPENRSFLIAAGLEQALSYLQNLQFDEAEIDYLKEHPVFKNVTPAFFDYLKSFRFTGDVWAIPEGTLVFPHEPLLRISAPVIEAQLVETYLLSMINFQTLIASKAARVCLAANQDNKERAVIDFGSRRAHGPEAAVLAARAAYIGGCIGTSNVYAGMHMGLPIFGTAAHSWTMAFEHEMDAFETYQQVFPEHTTLLIDTYDTLEGARKAVQIGTIQAVRIDSGDFYASSHAVRNILDEGGCSHVKIVVSGDMNEYKIADLIARGAPIDAFGVGTELVTSKDAPALGGVYKLVEQTYQDGTVAYKLKLSSDKATYPGAKQIYRYMNSDGLYDKDCIALIGEPAPLGAQPLQQHVMSGGSYVGSKPSLAEIRTQASRELTRLPLAYHLLRGETPYPVERSESLEQLFQTLKKRQRGEKKYEEE